MMRATSIPLHMDRDCPATNAPDHPLGTMPRVEEETLAPIFRKRRMFPGEHTLGSDHEHQEPGISNRKGYPSSSPTFKSSTSTKRLKVSRPTNQADINPSRWIALKPLAEELRPRCLEEFVGQEHIFGPDAPFRAHVKNGTFPSSILWGPPGSGKTTMARIIAMESISSFKELSATTGGVGDVRKIVEEAKSLAIASGRRTILFLDEIHRFNRSQQDTLLPHIEDGTIQLVQRQKILPSKLFLLYLVGAAFLC